MSQSIRVEALSDGKAHLARGILREYLLLAEQVSSSPWQARNELPAVLARECEQIEGMYAFPHRFFLASCGGELAGCVGVKLRDPDAEIARLYVRAPFRRRGVATHLTARSEAYARALGVRRLVLNVRPERQTVIDWYRRLGFTEVGPYEQLPMGIVFLGKDL
jgi:ribosomal protein S18 acetylase RimI-like enzyme